MFDYAGGDNAIPLTQAELGIWLGQQLNPASAFYNAAEVIDIQGQLSASAFGAALCHALAEAPAMHRVFRETIDGARQFFTPLKPNVAVLDFSAQAGAMKVAETWMRENLRTPVDLSQGPLYQQALIKLADDHYLWYQRIHHIAADGFAFALFSQRVAEIYNSQIENRDSGKPLADKPLSNYNAVLQDDENYQQSEKREASRQFWCSRLPQQPRPVSLSRSRAPVEQWPLHLSALINAQAFTQLKNFGQALACNWTDVITGAVAALVYRYTAADDILLGMPIMGRIGTPALRVPAMVMNIAPLRIKTKNLLTLQDWTRQVAAEQTICRPHQRYRYEHLRRDLNAIGGDKRLYGPVVNIMPFDRQLRFGDTAVQVRNLSAGPVEDISFAFILQPDNSLRFDLEANPARYTLEQLSEFQKGFLDILENPAHPLEVTPEPFAWLSGEELPNSVPSVMELLRRQVHEQPEAIALVDGDAHLTYADLYQQARQFASGLNRHHVQSGDVVALSLPRGQAAVVSCLGCLLQGAAYVFLDPTGPDARNQRILLDASPKVVVSLNAQPGEIQYTTLLNSPLIKNVDGSDISEGNLAYLVYTSGSTGTPKGVMVGRRALAEFIAGAGRIYDVQKNDRVLQYAPLHFDASVEEIFVTLCQGATLVIRSESMLDSVEAFLDTCAQWQISVLDLPTAYWHELVYFCHSTHTPIPAAIHTLIIGGEAALPERVRQWHELNTQNIRLLNTYGPSETTVVASCAQLRMGDAISIGTPLPGRQMAVVDRQGRILKRNEAGELIVFGAGIGDGYRNMPDATTTRFRNLQFPWHAREQRAYFTGDRALITASGSVEFLGRLDAEIKISGHRINPVEIESAILSLGLARDVSVVPIIGEQKTLTAFIVCRDGQPSPTIQTLRQMLAEMLPPPMLPTQLKFLPQLPQNGAGKVDRKALAAIVSIDTDKIVSIGTEKIASNDAGEIIASIDAEKIAAGAAETMVGGDYSAEEQLVIRTWQQVLGISRIELDDDFFLLGGQSLQTIQVANRLSTALQRTIAVTVLFENPTVRQLASELSEYTPKTFAKNNDLARKDIEDDLARFQAELANAGEQRVKPLWHCRTILLTGATGFVGAQLLYQLLQAGDIKVICLVRAYSTANAFEKISAALAKQNLEINNLHDKIDIVLADLEQPGFGLTREEFHQLALQCDAVFHNAANTSVMRDYRSLRAANVLSTQTLLRFSAIKCVPFHLISTIAVAPEEGLPEDFVAWHKNLKDGYQQSKWAAERSVEIAANKGYPVSIYRLARVVGDLQSGAVNDKDLIWNIAAASVRNNVFPHLSIEEPWTPVDLVTRVVVANAQQSIPHPILNIVPPGAVALQDISEWLRDAGFALQTVAVKEWCEYLSKSSHQQDLAILGFFQQRETDSTAKMKLPAIVDQNTRRFMESHGILFPEITQRHFSRYLQEAINQRLISAPASPTSHERGLYEPA